LQDCDKDVRIWNLQKMFNLSDLIIYIAMLSNLQKFRCHDRWLVMNFEIISEWWVNIQSMVDSVSETKISVHAFLHIIQHVDSWNYVYDWINVLSTNWEIIRAFRCHFIRLLSFQLCQKECWCCHYIFNKNFICSEVWYNDLSL